MKSSRYGMEQVAGGRHGRLLLGNTTWQGGTGQQQGSVFTLGSGPAMVEVVSVCDGDHLGLVSHQPYASPHIRSHRTFKASFPQETVDSLNLVPALGSRHFWQKSGSFLATSLVMELYPDAMGPQVPVCVVGTIFKVTENGHRNMKAGELFPANRTEPGVFHGTCNGVLPQTLVELHLVEGPNTTSELLILPNLPSNEKGIVFVTERWDLRGLEVVKVAVQNVETEIAHFRFDDPEAPTLIGHHGARVVPVLLLPPILVPTVPSHPVPDSGLFQVPLPPKITHLSFQLSHCATDTCLKLL